MTTSWRIFVDEDCFSSSSLLVICRSWRFGVLKVICVVVFPIKKRQKQDLKVILAFWVFGKILLLGLLQGKHIKDSVFLEVLISFSCFRKQEQKKLTLHSILESTSRKKKHSIQGLRWNLWFQGTLFSSHCYTSQLFLFFVLLDQAMLRPC